MNGLKFVKPSDSLEVPRQGPAATADSHSHRWRTALLLASSALFGGLAVAIWNRRQIACIRNAQQEGESASSFTDADPGDEV